MESKAVLVAHIEFIAWATRPDLDIIRRLSPEQITRELISSFPSMYAAGPAELVADAFPEIPEEYHQNCGLRRSPR
jgi:hypothetical protein